MNDATTVRVSTLTGKVLSKKMAKTATVVIERIVKHKLYGKYITRTTKLLVHDEQDTCQEGDIVIIKQSRPYSKRKSWELVEVVKKAA